MRNVLFLFLLILPFWSFSKVFYFTGSADNDFANPENWTPTYPGANIHEKDSIYIQSDLNINDGSIVLAGRVEILMGVSFYAKTSSISVLPTGKLINQGELYVAFLDNNGLTQNDVSGLMVLDSCKNRLGAVLDGMLTSYTIIRKNILNQGKWECNSSTLIQGEVRNEGNIDLSFTAKMEIKGMYRERGEGRLRKSQNATFMVEKQEIQAASYSELMMNVGNL
jgi:hypothetical protein